MTDSLTFSGTSSVLEAQYFPPIELSRNKSYFLGLVKLLSFNFIPNINEGINSFYMDKEIVILPTGSYEIKDIESFLRELLSRRGILISIRPNNNTAEENQVYSSSLFSFAGFHRRVVGFRSAYSRTKHHTVPI